MFEQDLITGVRFFGVLSMITMAVIVALVNRGRAHSRVYNLSRWLICVACFLLGIHFLLQFYGHFRVRCVSLAWVVNLIFYVPTVLAFNLGIRNLLYAGHSMRPPLIYAASHTVVCYLLLVIGYATDTLINDQQPYLTMTFLVACLLFAESLRMAWVMYGDLRLIDQRLSGQDLDECRRFLFYTSLPTRILLSLALFIPWVGMSGSLMLNGVFGLVIFGVILWLVIGFCLYYHDMPQMIEPSQTTSTDDIETPEVSDYTKDRIEQWILSRQFTNPKLTIADALEQMGVSADALNGYLGRYTDIPSYRKWLPYLRVEEAKRLMLAHPEFSLQAIAEACGYANNSNLSRAFKAQLGLPPVEWLSVTLKEQEPKHDRK